jgi:hypothetical protein
MGDSTGGARTVPTGIFATTVLPGLAITETVLEPVLAPPVSTTRRNATGFETSSSVGLIAATN